MNPSFLNNIVESINQKILESACGATASANGLCFQTKQNNVVEYVNKDLQLVSIDSDFELSVFHIIASPGRYVADGANGRSATFRREFTLQCIVYTKYPELLENIETAIALNKGQLKDIETDPYKVIRNLYGQTEILPDFERLLCSVSYLVYTNTIENCKRLCQA